MTLRVAHVITGLETGGGEVLLGRLVERLDASEVAGPVVSLTSKGEVAARIEAAGVEVQALEMKTRPGPRDLRRLRAAITAARPDVVQTWLLHSNVLGGLAASVPTKIPVVWGVHQNEATRASFGASAAVLQKLERRLSRWVPRRIVACSASAEDMMRRSGYDAARIERIDNGFDSQVFHPDEEDRQSVRAELAVDGDTPVVGHVARFHPVKDQATLLGAFKLLLDARPEAVLVMAGEGLDPGNADLAKLTGPLGDSIRLLGPRGDVPRLMRGFDVAVLSSAGEALPLVIGEAMATGLPFVSTDVGDAREVIGDTGRVVPVRDPQALAAALGEVIAAPPAARRQMGFAARERIDSERSLEDMVGRYVDLWSQVADQARSARTRA